MTKIIYQLFLRDADNESQIEDFDLDAFFPPLPAGQRLELPNHGTKSFRIMDSSVEIRHIAEANIMRYSTILYVARSEENGPRY